MKSSLFVVAAYCAAADNGEEIQCFGSRAHKVTYDIQGGDSLDTITDADIVVRRESALDDLCSSASHSGYKPICIGANVDETCEKPLDILPINDHFECQRCFGGVTTDLYYHYQVKGLSLEKVEVGIQNTKIRGALDVHAHGVVAAQITSGTISVPDRTASFNFTVKGIPIDVKISVPTTLRYNLALEGHFHLLAGADLDIDFGDHFISWDKTNGFEAHNTDPTVNLSPKLVVDIGDSGADIDMSLHSSIQVDVNSVLWYHVNLEPDFPSKLSYEKPHFCLTGDMDFPISHEAALHHTLWGHDVIAKHFGPVELAHLHEDQIIKKCTNGSGPSPAPATGVSIQSTASGFCLDLPGGDTQNGNILWMWECYGGDTQQWSFQDNQLVYLPDTTKCLDLLGGDATNSNHLGIWDCYGGDRIGF